MDSTNIATALSLRRPLNGSGVRRISGGDHEQKQRHRLKIGTWNVRSLKQHGKLHNVIKEMRRLEIGVLVILNGQETIDTRPQRAKYLYYSGKNGSTEPYGVAVLLTKETAQAVRGFIPHSNRSMLLCLEAKLQNINIIQVYAPTADKPQNEFDEFYAEVRNLLQYTKKHDINIIMGDLNAKVGSGEVPGVIGPYGLGVRNERGEALIEFCQEHELVVTNTLFKHHPRRLYTWTSPAHTPDHIARNQIDYIAINSRFKNSIKSAQTYPGVLVSTLTTTPL
ncbi:unnamed protein product [Pieris macdunnoughi]|uniref:Endonuclease/exonuclease/phosphatase domain-containing protein n=1 Tax=Pieris macdunnoughi TaxID=345717 RepID=A0A821Y6R3_9NEOP|nr:unnamed protein product [Pieris macdunnoughi]